MVDTIKAITRSTGFNRFIMIMIILSGVLVGLETYPAFDNATAAGQGINQVQNVILWIFAVEIAIKIAACGNRPWMYFAEPWHWVDFAVVAVCFLPLDATFATVFRMARLLRTLRMVTILPRLQVLVSALLKSIPSLGYIGILLGLHFYVYSVAGTFLFKANDPLRFGTLQETSLTLFQVLTLEGWNDVLATQYLGSDTHYDETWKATVEEKHLERKSSAQPVVASIYFVSFIMLGTMIMLNLFTGVIISSMEEATAENKEEAIEKKLKTQGFLTLRDELAALGHQLNGIGERLKGIELKEEERLVPH